MSTIKRNLGNLETTQEDALVVTTKRRKKLSDTYDPLMYLLYIIFIVDQDPSTGINGTWVRDLLEIVREYARDLRFPIICFEHPNEINLEFSFGMFVNHDILILYDKFDFLSSRLIHWSTTSTRDVIKKVILDQHHLLQFDEWNDCGTGTNILCTDTYILVGSSRYILQFDINGNFIRQLFQANHSTRISSMVLTIDGATLYVSHGYQKFARYHHTKKDFYIERIDMNTTESKTVLHESTLSCGRDYTLLICPRNRLYLIVNGIENYTTGKEESLVYCVDTVNKQAINQLKFQWSINDTWSQFLVTESGYFIRIAGYESYGHIEAVHLLTGQKIILSESGDVLIPCIVSMQVIKETKSLYVMFRDSFMSVPLPFQLFLPE